MTKEQIIHLFEVYKKDPFVRYQIDGNTIRAINIHTGCKHIFVNGEDEIIIPSKHLSKVKEYINGSL